MLNQLRTPRGFWRYFRTYVAQITTGGSWTAELSTITRRNLRWFWFDGLFASASDNIMLTYLSLYVLALGASRAQIGLMSSLSSLSAALMLLPGAMLAERWGRRKWITVISGGGISRLMLLILILVPISFQGNIAVVAAIGISVLRDAFSNLSLPAWVSLTADIVPLSWRGRYFASRNIIMGISGMAFTLAIGQLITQVGQPSGYQVAIGIAFLVGMVSTYSFSHLKEPILGKGAAPLPPISIQALVRDPAIQPGFYSLCATAALWNFSLNVAGPFFNIYLVQGLGATAAVVGGVTIVSSLSSLPAQRLFGPLTDRWGPHRVQLVTGLLIPILPLAWVFVRSPWQVVPINLLSGILWAGYLLASFNFLLLLTPQDQRARFTAIYQVIVTISLAAGAALGGQVATRFGYHAIFILSGVGRLTAALLFARFVPQPKPVQPEGNHA